MATYVIGDVQGCFKELTELLRLIEFQLGHDTLIFTGDLVNRGPESLAMLRFAAKTPNVVSVLGNHDLTLLALAYTSQKIANHNLHDILSAPDRESLLTWLRQQPLIYQTANVTIVHAGIPPQWSIPEALSYAHEVELQLVGDQYQEFFKSMFGNEPNQWSETLAGIERYRYIINSLTRMRFCNPDGSLNFTHKGTVEERTNLTPWFLVADRKAQNEIILFGHWAALRGKTYLPKVISLDTGCVWGCELTALRLEDWQQFHTSCAS